MVLDSGSGHRRTLATFFGDGLWDIALGLGILTFALGAVLDLALLPALLVPVVIGVAWFSRVQLAQRLRPIIPPLPESPGSWPFSLWVGIGAAVVLGLLIPILSMAARNGESLVRDVRLLPVGITLAIIVAIIGPLCERWYMYAAIIASVSTFGWMLEWPAWVDFTISGAIITAMGAYMLRTFALGRAATDGSSPQTAEYDASHSPQGATVTSAAAATTWPDTIEIQPVDRPISGTPQIPGSKSITNRALVTAALASGTSTLTGALFSDDTHYMAQGLNQLGILVRTDEATNTMQVEGAGGRIPASSADLFIGNSGTTARFLAAVVALGEGTYRIDGDEAMRKRPIGPLLDALRQLGIDASSELGNDRPPISITSTGMPGGEVSMHGNLSSQYFTGLLLAAPAAHGDIAIHVEGELISRPYIDITAEVMRAFGVRTVLNETTFRVMGGQQYEPRDYRIEPDASAASYFFAVAAITGGTITVDGLGTSALQGDLEFVRVLEAMGCTVDMTETATTVTGPADGRLRGGEFDFANISDTSQTLAGIAPFADSPVSFRGVAHNRVKETDRVGNVVKELRKLGQEVEEFEDGMTIHPRPVTPALVETYNDHRMAMGFALTGLRAPGVVISNPACVTKTLPAFFEMLDRLTESS